jgi:hypothetical protein
MDPRQLRDLMKAVREAREAFEPLRREFERHSVEIAQTIQTAQSVAATIQPILSSEILTWQRLAAETATLYRAAFGGSSITSLLVEVERVRPVVAAYFQQIAEAADERSRWATLREVAQEVVTAGIELNLGTTITPQTRKERIALYVAILLFLINMVLSQLADARREAATGNLRNLIVEQQQTLTILTDTLQKVQADIGVRGPVLRVTKNARLREEPDPQTRRLKTLKAGERVEVVTAVRRWYYVEVLTKDGHRTGLRGWVYRRNVELR